MKSCPRPQAPHTKLLSSAFSSGLPVSRLTRMEYFAVPRSVSMTVARSSGSTMRAGSPPRTSMKVSPAERCLSHRWSASLGAPAQPPNWPFPSSPAKPLSQLGWIRSVSVILFVGPRPFQGIGGRVTEKPQPGHAIVVTSRVVTTNGLPPGATTNGSPGAIRPSSSSQSNSMAHELHMAGSTGTMSSLTATTGDCTTGVRWLQPSRLQTPCFTQKV
jgi:hypothetical protein